MRIQLIQVGGYAGTIPVKELNTEDKEVVNRINQLVNQASRADIESEQKEVGADLMQYELKVTDNNETKTLTFPHPTEDAGVTSHPSIELYNYIKKL